MNGTKQIRVGHTKTKRQAESFFKVMVANKFSPLEISETLSHMGAMFVGYAEDVVNKAKNKSENLK